MAGRITLGLQTPFALNGAFDSTGVLDDISVENHVRLSGSLQDVGARTHLSGKGISLNAETMLHPVY